MPVGLPGMLPANERMQLTWLLGAPGRPVSVHQRAVGQGGLGSPATQLMRAVSRSMSIRQTLDALDEAIKAELGFRRS